MNKKIAVLVDSSCGLDRGQAKKQGLAFQALQIVHNASETLHDGIDVSSTQLYEMIERGDSLKTSQSPLGENMKIAEGLLKDHDLVFCVPLSSGLSGAYNTWKAVQQEINNQRLQVIDAKTVATGVVDLATKIKGWAEAGETTATIHERVAEVAKNTYGLLVCNDFARLVQGGRLSAFKGALASLLKLHVLIEFKDGKLSFKDKSRSEDKLVKNIRTRIYEQLQITDDEQVESLTFLHTFPEKNRSQMEKVLGEIKATFGPKAP